MRSSISPNLTVASATSAGNWSVGNNREETVSELDFLMIPMAFPAIAFLLLASFVNSFCSSFSSGASAVFVAIFCRIIADKTLGFVSTSTKKSPSIALASSTSHLLYVVHSLTFPLNRVRLQSRLVLVAWRILRLRWKKRRRAKNGNQKSEIVVSQNNQLVLDLVQIE